MYVSNAYAIHTHTHTHTQIYICVCVCVCVYIAYALLKQQKLYSHIINVVVALKAFSVLQQITLESHMLITSIISNSYLKRMQKKILLFYFLLSLYITKFSRNVMLNTH